MPQKPPLAGVSAGRSSVANEPACKPDSVLTSEGRSSIWDPHCCAPRATYPLMMDEQPVSAGTGVPSWSCSRWGLPSRPGHPERW